MRALYLIAVFTFCLGQLMPAVGADRRAVLLSGHQHGLSLPLVGSVNEVFIGDSITHGTGGVTPYPTQVLSQQPSTYSVENEGVGGATTISTIYGTTPNTLPLASILSGDRNGAKNVNVMFTLLGVNDICSYGAAASDVYVNLQNIWRIGRQYGYKVVAMTLIDSNCYNQGVIITLDSLIRSIPSYYDALVDLAADPTMGCVDCANNKMYFIDGVHPTTAGDTIIAQAILAAIYSVPLSQPGNVFLVNGIDPLYLINGSDGVCLTKGAC